MLHQGIFNLDGTDPQALDLHHVIGAADVPVIAIGIAIVLITGAQPMSLDGVFGFFMLVPVAGPDRVTLNKKVANLTVRNRLALFIHDAGLITFQNLSTGARAHRSRTVGDEHVQRLGRADGVQNLDAEALAKAMVKSCRQRLACGNSPTDAAQIGGRRVFTR